MPQKKEKGKFQLNATYSGLISSSTDDDTDISMEKENRGKIQGMKEVFSMNVNQIQILRRESSKIGGPIKR